ncbi:MAG: glycosyl hydrolase [Gemmatimonadota bacterium]|nr:glycosyl hydrolase [Gemmatimonadota bacterium]
MSTLRSSWLSFVAAALPLLLALPADGSAQVDPSLFQSMSYRNIGPFRGGRVTTVTGVPGETFTFYMGATGGGVWKTTDAGTSWYNISDGYFNTTGIGSIAVAPSDHNVVYVGTGEGPVRGVKTSHGDGVYKSTDAGATWEHVGLEATRHISRILVHPRNPDRVYVAAQGNPWGPNDERGVYRSDDGGRSWRMVLHVNEDSGIADLSVDAHNPDVMMATSWDFRRRPWVVKSGGPGSRVYKTTDGGESWREITAGLPDLKGKMGVAISPADPNVVYLAIEAKDGQGGVYRSDDAGEHFRQVSDDPRTWARAWYYMHIIADPQDADEVWVMNSGAMKSIDGGRTYSRIPDSHVDHHALWINPENSDIMINGNDGGASVTFNGGRTWSTLLNQPTAQMYRVMTDNQYPYHVYSGQQDASGIVIASRTLGDGIGEHDWQTIRSGESATVALDPENPRYVYTTFFASFLGEWDARTQNYRMIRPYPERVTGEEPRNLKYRANWNGPVIVSPHDPGVIYYGSQYLMKSTDRGTSWEVISPDLTRNDKDHQGPGGYPISNEQITAESYNNLFNIEESPLEEGVIWVGSDDGLVHVTRDGGVTWRNVTPAGLPESIINVVEPSPHDPATAYFAAAAYKMDDFTPYLYKTDDYGATWRKIVNGIPGNTFARSIREDPDRRGLLYAGTETGVYVSFDDGGVWQELQLDLPEVPITDLRIRQKDLVVSTQGRSLWILDDLTPLHQISDAVAEADYHLYAPRDAVRNITPGYYAEGGFGENPPEGLQVHYVLNAPVAEDTPLSMEILDGNGRVVYAERSPDDTPDCPASPRPRALTRKPGANRWSWNMRVGRFACLEEITATSPDLSAYSAVPGRYQVRLTVGDLSQARDFEIRMDPRIAGITADPVAEYAELDRLSASLFDAATEMARGVTELRRVQRQLDFVRELSTSAEVTEGGEALDRTMDDWIALILQKELKTFQNAYQHEARLLMKFKDLLERMGGANLPLTEGVREVTGDYLEEWSGIEVQLRSILNEDIPAYNEILRAAGLPEIYLPRPVT